MWLYLQETKLQVDTQLLAECLGLGNVWTVEWLGDSLESRDRCILGTWTQCNKGCVVGTDIFDDVALQKPFGEQHKFGASAGSSARSALDDAPVSQLVPIKDSHSEDPH